jgi:hypothetical protein
MKLRVQRISVRTRKEKIGMIITRKLIATTAVFLALSVGSFAADTSGKVLGTVIDTSGNPIPQAAVALTNTATGVKQSAMTDGQGTFAFPVVPVGAWELVVDVSLNVYTKSNIRQKGAAAKKLEDPVRGRKLLPMPERKAS